MDRPSSLIWTSWRSTPGAEPVTADRTPARRHAADTVPHPAGAAAARTSMLTGRDRGGCDSRGSFPQQIAVETAVTVGELHAAVATEHGLGLLIAHQRRDRLHAAQQRSARRCQQRQVRPGPGTGAGHVRGLLLPDTPPEWAP